MRWLTVIVIVMLTAVFVPCLSRAEEPAVQVSTEPFPVTKTIKGLQVQMLDDAITLGVEHAALNVDLTRFIDPSGKAGGPSYTRNGQTWHFAPHAVAHLDERVKPLSDKGVVVYLILLTYASGDKPLDQIMIHPDYAWGQKHTGPISMFNLTTPESTDWLRACIEFIAQRYSREQGHGRVWGYISGNEVNSHWHWANMGEAPAGQVIAAYERSTRLIHEAVRRFSQSARVYISLDHFWHQRYAISSDRQAIGGREFLERFAARVKEEGDFDWHLAHHPYPEPLTDPRFWLDTRYSRQALDAHSITFRNLDVLTDFMQQEPLLYQGEPRRIILSEQGFHCVESRQTGELEQAAAYALAYKKVNSLPGIDAFILHRHTDHAREGGLNLGLWTNKKGEICTPDRKRLMYEVFQKAGTPEEATAFEFALPVIGSQSWEEALEKLKVD